MSRSKAVSGMSESFQNLFPQGGPNTVAGQYFSGASYLHLLSSEGGAKSPWGSFTVRERRKKPSSPSFPR